MKFQWIIVCGVIFSMGCHHHVRGIDLQAHSAEKWLHYLKSHQKNDSYQAEVGIEYQDQHQKWSGMGAVINDVSQGRLRIDVMNDFGFVHASLLNNGEQVQVYYPSQKICFVSKGLQSIPLFGVPGQLLPLPARIFNDLLMGYLPESVSAVSALRCDSSNQCHFDIVWFPSELNGQIHIRQRSGEPYLSKIRLKHKDGWMDWSYQDWKQQIPDKVSVQAIWHQTNIEYILYYRHVEYVAHLNEKFFKLNLPEDTRLQFLSD